MTIKEIDSISGLIEIKSAWDEMLRRSPNNKFYLSSEWIELYWRHFGADARMMIITVWDGSELIGALPLCAVNDRILGIKRKTIRWLGYRQIMGLDLPLTRHPKRSLEAVLQYLLNNRRRWDIIRLDDLKSDSETYPLLRNLLLKMRVPFDEVEGASSPYVSITGSWEEYWSTRSRSVRKKMRQRLRKAQTDHDFRISYYHRGQNLDWIMNKVFEIESRSWKFKSGTSILSDPKEMNFYLDLARMAARKNWLGLSILELDGRPVAYSFRIEYAGKVLCFKTSYDENFKDISPGKLIHYDLMEKAFEEGFSEINFGGHAEEYKMDFADEKHDHVNLTIFNTRSPFILFYARSALKRIDSLRKLRRKLSAGRNKQV